MTDLSRLTPVPLRDIWTSEATDFTPWLARDDNLALLGDTLGFDLELEAVERNVGPFRADILCKDTVRDRWVLIENQLERTDHTHLGQLITYAAGLDAVTIVWIAARVAEEHRAAVDWLNEITDTDVRFFVLEVELWRIGDSPAAPKFNIVSQPNDWARITSRAGTVIGNANHSPLKGQQLEYWTELEALLATSGGPVRPVKPQPASWIAHGVGRTNFGLNAAMNTRENWVRAEIYIGGDAAKGYFFLLYQRKEELESSLGFALDWQRLEAKKDARICISRPESDLRQRLSWPDQHAWLVDKLNRMHATFGPVIRELDRDEAELFS